MSNRDIILKRLRKAQQPFDELPPAEKQIVSPIADTSPAGLRGRFIEEAEKLNATVWQPGDPQEALDQLLELIGGDSEVLAWDFDAIPLGGLEAALSEAKIQVAAADNGSVRVGITGVDAAIAATGSIVVKSGAKTPRTVSLLPYVHIAIIRQDQILPQMEAWTQRQDRAAFRAISNINIISGASRTADIGMELVLGAHGPADLHLMLVE